MAFALRTALLSKNATLVKCVKGRSFITASNRKTLESLSTAAACRTRKEKKTHPVGDLKTEGTKRLSPVKEHGEQHGTRSLRYCMSCPNLTLKTKTKHELPARHFDPSRNTAVCYEPITTSSVRQSNPVNTSLLKPTRSQIILKRTYSKQCSCGGCTCPFPCGPCGCPSGCGCLPPPCNQPPRCVQYMTGYYYYPYGYWFCGPYHVSGTCAPVDPCGPSAPSGPSCTSESKGPAPASACSAAAALVDTHALTANSEISPKANIPNAYLDFPNQETKPTQQSRSGISKFFAFNTTIAPGIISSDSKDCKKPPSSPSSSLTPKHSKDRPTYCTPYISKGSDLSTNPPRSSRISKAGQTNSFSKTSTHPFPKSISDYENIRQGCRSPIRHKRSRKYLNEVCPTLEKPRTIMTREERDRPIIKAGLFHYSSIPQYKSPYPQPLTLHYNL